MRVIGCFVMAAVAVGGCGVSELGDVDESGRDTNYALGDGAPGDSCSFNAQCGSEGDRRLVCRPRHHRFGTADGIVDIFADVFTGSHYSYQCGYQGDRRNDDGYCDSDSDCVEGQVCRHRGLHFTTHPLIGECDYPVEE